MRRKTARLSKDQLRTPAVFWLPVGDLKPNPRNPRTHSPQQIGQIAAIIKEVGFINPIIVDSNNVIYAGHGRLEAAKLLGLKFVLVRCVDHLTSAQLRAYALADNKLALKAGWDEVLLKAEFTELQALDLDFDLRVTGFEFGEIDFLSQDREEPGPSELDEVPPPPKTSVIRRGDLWQIGKHRLICGDARDDATYAGLMGNHRAQMVISDPPFNVRIDGHASGLGKAQHREFAMASGEMSQRAFTHFLGDTFRRLAAWSQDGALHYLFMDWRHMTEILEAGEVAYSELKNVCVWAKTNAGMGSLYRSQHELIFVYKSGRASHINNVELGKHGRYRTNLWNYAGANAFSATRAQDLENHPTVKPVGLVADAILDASYPKGIILDAFAGSGTTLVAAEKTRRIGYGIEIDPIYCEVILQRLADVTGITPILEASGQPFELVREERMEAALEGGA